MKCECFRGVSDNQEKVINRGIDLNSLKKKGMVSAKTSRNKQDGVLTNPKISLRKSFKENKKEIDIIERKLHNV